MLTLVGTYSGRRAFLLSNREKTMRTKMLILAAMLLVAGCGTDPGERAASGALIGAAGGAAIGAAAGNPGLGAAAGAVAGGVVGAATDPCELNLGDPVWRDHGGRDAYERRCGHAYRDRY
jgi:osmotically inducible lipoprotein OsmB